MGLYFKTLISAERKVTQWVQNNYKVAQGPNI